MNRPLSGRAAPPRSASFLYLHGFASHPGSAKPVFFTSRLRALGFEARSPDLNQPSFESVTLTAMIEQTRIAVAELPPGPVVLIGSSFGAPPALQLAARYHSGTVHDESHTIAALVLLAPALDFCGCTIPDAGSEPVDQWERTGRRSFRHARTGAIHQVHFGLVEDVRQHDSYAVRLPIPTLILHGSRDETVPVEQSVRFAAERPEVVLRLIDSDHSLASSLELCWEEMIRFLEERKVI